MSILQNILLDTDSYKFSHFSLMPPQARYASSYIEARGPIGAKTVFVGPQMFVKRYLLPRITHEQVDEAKEVVTTHGLPFNEDAFRIIVNEHNGRLPLRIKAVREGTKVSTSNVLSTVENTDPRFPWLPSFIETAYLRACWYPTTTATHAHENKQVLRKYLSETSDLTSTAFEQKLSFMLHCFGARGVSSKESAELGGLGHLVNFQGTDTISALLAARVYYNEPMAGYSIPASEHSVVTSWGKEHEVDFYRHQLKVSGQTGAMFASVIDSYDAAHAVRDLWGGTLKAELIASGAKLILRPDSGDPTITMPRLLNIAGSAFGFTINSKGYKVLPSYVGFIQGDGITRQTLPLICASIKAANWSLENMAFGQGGGGLQQVNRDDFKFAMKTSAVFLSSGGWKDHVAQSGDWVDVYKNPIDDPTKRSKGGRLGLYSDSAGNDVTGPAGQADDRLETIYDGDLTRDQRFIEIRKLAAL